MSCCASSVSHLPGDQRGAEPQKCCTSSTGIKTTLFVLGFLLIGAGAGLYFAHINTIAAYAAAGVGLATVIGTAIKSVVDCSGKKNEALEEVTLDMSGNNASLPKEQVQKLLSSYPNLKTIYVKIRTDRMNIKRLGALDPFFTWNAQASRGEYYVFERRQK